MGILFIPMRKRPTSIGILVGMGAFVVLALVIMFSAGNARAAGVAPLIGRFIFKFHPAINLGACGGARTSTASAAMVSDAAKSDVPMLGYAVPYAINASLMAMLGMLIVLLY